MLKVQAKDGFQFLYVDGRFSKIQSHMTHDHCGYTKMHSLTV